MDFASRSGEAGVSKAVGLCIALLVGLGPGMGLLCRAWCDHHRAELTSCHDPGHGDATRVSTADDCDERVLAGMPFMPEAARRSAAPPVSHVQHAGGHEFFIGSLDRRPPLRAESGHPFQGPPLSVNLRI